MAHKISTNEIAEITSLPVTGISEGDRDEMAIPTYLHYNPLIRWLMWKRYEHISKLCHPSQHGTALEFGCGIGLFLPELDKKYGTVYAMDLFPQYAKELAKRHQLNIRFIDDFNRIPESSLDTIIAADVLEHIENLKYYLDIFRNKLKPDGEFLVSGPTENIFYKAGRILAGFGDKGDYHHTNIEHLIRDISDHGFVIDRIVGLPFVLPPYLFRICRFTISV